MARYRAIFISDVHLGTKACMADELCSFLEENECQYLYLIGDIIDGWRVLQNKWKWNRAQTKVIETILHLSRDPAMKIVYVPGNHDDFLRRVIGHEIAFKGLELHNQYTHEGADGKHYLITHGDLFDELTSIAPWVAYLGDKAYDVALLTNYYLNRIRRRLGFEYWSVSSYLKHRVKRAVNFIFRFEENLARYCKHKGFDGVICGHIHHAEIKELHGITYMNDGDWVESGTAIVEKIEGSFEIVRWAGK